MAFFGVFFFPGSILYWI